MGPAVVSYSILLRQFILEYLDARRTRAAFLVDTKPVPVIAMAAGERDAQAAYSLTNTWSGKPGVIANKKSIRREDMVNNHLLGGLFKSTVLVIAVLGLCSPKSWSDSITFRESEKDSVECSKDWGCGTSTRGRFTMNGLFFTDADLSGFQSLLVTNTWLSISVGDWGASMFLRDDPKYQDGDTKATIRPICCTNTCVIGRHIRNAISTAGTIKFSASSNGIAISITSASTPCFGYYSAIVDHDAGNTGAVTNILAVSIVLSNDVTALTTNIEVTVTGTASIKSVTKQGDVFDLNSVKVNGKQ